MSLTPNDPARLERRLPLAEVDAETRNWVRNAADELAARSGCRFDGERGQFVVDWIEDYCTLYEGEWAGQQMILSDWQLECTLRMFGWVRWSDKWEREVRRFREADVFIAKKNAKTPTEAAWALYLLCGDGEPGQKVYLGAKDGSQARDLAGRHVLSMVEMSPRLSAVCKINRNEASVTHLPSRSILKPLSSSSERTQKSKEGLNGSVLLDETHVLDRAFVDIISRAGISRSEPMFIKVSTAGNDPDSYGKYRFDYALQVEAGKVEDQGLFTAVYAAPQDVTDTEIDADPVKYGRMANPAWGRLIDPEEFAEDYRKSRAAGTAEFVLFKMYRLNVWCRAANPWLRMADWEACGREYTLESLRGRRAWLGMDLSRTRDMTAVVAAVEGDGPEEFWLWPLFWLPEETARAVAKLVPFLAWAEAGLLTLTPGRTTDYGFVRTAVRQLAEVLDVQGLFYDETYAEQLTQQLSDGEYAATGEVLVAGLGIERTAFPQKMVALAGPTADFERFILQGTIRHPRHPVLDWQVGHACVYMDANGNKRPIKPKNADSLKKIDGVVGSIMGVAGAMQGTGVQMSVYNHRRLVTLGHQEPERRGRFEPPPQAEGGRDAGRPAGRADRRADDRTTAEGHGPPQPTIGDLFASRWAEFVAGGDDD